MVGEQINSANEAKGGNFDERIPRWETHRISFLSFIINLIFTLTGGSFWLWYQVLKDDKIGSCPVWQLISGLMLAISFLLGIATMLNRLEDFRLTVKKIKLERRGSERTASEDRRLGVLETQTTKYGKRTYWLFYLQIAFFVIGNSITFVSIILNFKLL